ncbi:MAG: hypothetical protein PHV74_10285 [Dehalococcoidia bacterium]|nr:hypothetical protein [Dehalococcoidia bacterium]
MKDRGKFNRTKLKCLLTPQLNERHAWSQYGILGKNYLLMSQRDIASWSGISPSSLRNLLPRWNAWGLVSSTAALSPTGKPVRVYQLAPRGRQWLEQYAQRCLDVPGTLKEIEIWLGRSL